MDGTIADLYGIPGWLDELRAESEKPFQVARPLYDTQELNAEVAQLKKKGYRIVITSWLPMGASPQFKEKVRNAKIDWLEEHDFDYDEIHLIKYGTTKANSTRKKGKPQILVDDNARVRKGWRLGKTIDANKCILTELRKL